MNIENLVLFIYETALLKDIEYVNIEDGDYILSYPFGPDAIDQVFISQLNHFIEKTYQENKELLEVIFNNIPLLDDYIKGNYDILDYKTLVKVLSKYRGINGYLSLVDTISKETDKKLNELALKFLEYYNNILELYNEKYTGYKKILQ